MASSRENKYLREDRDNDVQGCHLHPSFSHIRPFYILVRLLSLLFFVPDDHRWLLRDDWATKYVDEEGGYFTRPSLSQVLTCHIPLLRHNAVYKYNLNNQDFTGLYSRWRRMGNARDWCWTRRTEIRWYQIKLKPIIEGQWVTTWL